MTGISCRSSDRKKPKKYHKKPKKTEKYRKKPKKTEKSRKIPKKNRTLPQISNLGLVFFGFFRFFLGCNPPPPHNYLVIILNSYFKFHPSHILCANNSNRVRKTCTDGNSSTDGTVLSSFHEKNLCKDIH